MTKLPTLGAYVLYFVVSSSLRHLILHSLEGVPENDGVGDLYIHVELCLKDSMPFSVLEVY